MKIWTRVRDAVSGRFVKREEAKTRPESTFTEKVQTFVVPKKPS